MASQNSNHVLYDQCSSNLLDPFALSLFLSRNKVRNSMLTNISVMCTKLTTNLYSFGHYERLDSWGKEGRIQKEKMQIMGEAAYSMRMCRITTMIMINFHNHYFSSNH